MPCEYEIDLTRRLVRTRAWCVLTHAEVAAVRLRYTNDPAFRPDFSQLYDFRDVTKLSMTGGEIRELAGHSPFARGVRRAAIAPQTAVFGALRMFATLHEAGGGQDQIEVFRSLAEANAWLGLEE
jgi:hypothetical protein